MVVFPFLFLISFAFPSFLSITVLLFFNFLSIYKFYLIFAYFHHIHSVELHSKSLKYAFVDRLGNSREIHGVPVAPIGIA